jgi:hypothetical protein
MIKGMEQPLLEHGGGARGQESQRRGGSPNARMKEWNLIEGEWHCSARPSSFTQTMGLLTHDGVKPHGSAPDIDISP